MRISQFLSQAGITSRRKAEKLVLKGLVRVNGKVIRDLSYKINPYKDTVLFDGKKIELKKDRNYFIFYKPVNVLTASNDRYGRKLVKDYFKDFKGRLFPAGRLDYNSEGLLIMTDDGELTYRLTHPRYEVEKEYIVYYEGILGDELETLLYGIKVGDDFLKAEYIERIGKNKIRVILKEGKKREIRRMLGAIGCKVKRLIRVREGPIRLGNLKEGESRRLTKREIEILKKAVGLD
uniref:Pseudouridine synthase n=1 Tax=candidate division WOR-3 bacterium TaxID=2052148 RepID=A0A7C4U661_UNCW3